MSRSSFVVMRGIFSTCAILIASLSMLGTLWSTIIFGFIGATLTTTRGDLPVETLSNMKALSVVEPKSFGYSEGISQG